MANIPTDIIQSCILPRLPVKSLTRFKSVSKSWQTLISSPDFIRLHRHHTRSSDKNRFLVMVDETSHTFHLHELDSPSAPPLLLPYPNSMAVKIVASCEFVLLLSCSPHYNSGVVSFDIHWRRKQIRKTDELILLNPSTGSYHEIPHHSTQTDFKDDRTAYGLFFDEPNDNYKVARISQCLAPTQTEVTIYSSKTNSWTLIEQKWDTFDTMISIEDVAVVIGHLLHTIFWDKTTHSTRIGCFDIVAEQWTNDVPLPDNIDVDHRTCHRLCVLDRLLCGSLRNSVGDTCNQVWVMKEYGVKESWVKLWNIIYTRHTYSPDYLPITYREGSRHEILCHKYKYCNGDLFWHNIRTKKAEKVNSDGCRASSSGHVICKESLVKFAGGRHFSRCQLEIID